MSLRVLVVDDHEDTADSLRVLLKIWGYEARSVHSGEAALEAAGKFPPHVMLLDIGMPGLDGYQVAERVRKAPALKSIVLVAVSGYGRDEDRRRSMEAGFDLHLVKPVEPQDLAALLTGLRPDEDARRTLAVETPARL
jgi:CheY-like chemotaxis protein